MLLSLGLTVLSMVLWAALVLPVNQRIAEALGRDPTMVPDLWMRNRLRWQYGHAAAFASWLAGFISLTWAATRSSQAAEATGEPVARTAPRRRAST